MEQKIVKVGIGQVGNPTPKALTYIFRAYTFLAGLWVIFGPQLGHVDPATIAEINKWALLGVPIIQYTIKFFGLDYRDK